MSPIDVAVSREWVKNLYFSLSFIIFLLESQKHNYLNIFDIDIFSKIKIHVEEAGWPYYEKIILELNFYSHVC